jgi:hypothetical protein
MPHHARIPEPALGEDQGWRQAPAPAVQSGPRPIPHDRQPRQFVAAGPTRAARIGATPREIPGHDQLPLPDDHEQQQAVDAQPNAWLLPAPPWPHPPQLAAILLQEAVVPHPGPWPSTARGRAFGLEVSPPPYQHLLAQALQLSHPLPFGPRAQEPAGQVFIPPSDPAHLMRAAAANDRRETSSQRSSLRASAELGGATGSPRPRSLAALTPAPPVLRLAGCAGPAAAPGATARARVGGHGVWPADGAAAWHAGRADGMLASGSWKAPPGCCFTSFLSRRRP